MYVDGSLVALTVGTRLVFTTNYTDDVRIGSDFSGNYFGGKIDDVRIYGKALDATSVARLYAVTKVP